LEAAAPDVVLVGAFLVRQVSELHWLHDALDDHGAAETGAEAEKQHFAAPVASQGLHGGVVHDLYGTTKSPGEIEFNPTASQIVGFRSRAVSQHWAGIADRHHVIRPIRGKPF